MHKNIKSIPMRSVLYVPAVNQRAIAKIKQLNFDAVIIDLEDSVSVTQKQSARILAEEFLNSQKLDNLYKILRINSPSSLNIAKDLEIAQNKHLDAVLIPKIYHSEDIENIVAKINKPVMLMVETPAMIADMLNICQKIKQKNIELVGLVVGTNDIAQEMQIKINQNRENIAYILQKIILVAKATNLVAIDGVFADFKNNQKLENEIKQAQQLGYDGKTLIHPNQIEAANNLFAPTEQQINEAKKIIQIFEQPENKDKAVINLEGVMFEELHHQAAIRLMQKVKIIQKKQ